MNTVFYTGITNNITRRMYEHKNQLIKGLSQKYQLKKLVYIEEYASSIEVIAREKHLKNWHRVWKLNLIRESNPTFKELDSETSSE